MVQMYLHRPRQPPFLASNEMSLLNHNRQEAVYIGLLNEERYGSTSCRCPTGHLIAIDNMHLKNGPKIQTLFCDGVLCTGTGYPVLGIWMVMTNLPTMKGGTDIHTQY
jgi:hypothetical protein